MKDEAPSKKRKWYFHWAFILSVILAIAVIWLYISSQSTIRQLKDQHETTINQLNNDFQEFTQNSTISNYELIGQSFSWTVRKEMLNNNLDPVNNYFNILVKNDEIAELFLVNPEDSIILSSNKKYQGKSFRTLYDGKMLKVNKVNSFTPDKDALFVVTPVFGYEQRLATIVIKIKPDYFHISSIDR